MDALHVGVLTQKASDRERVGLMAIHAHRQGLQAAQQQPAVERAGHRATNILQKRQPLAECWVVGHDRAAHNVIVTIQVLGRAFDDQIDSEGQRLLKVGREPAVVHCHTHSMAVADLRDGGQIDNILGRIGGRFDPQHTRLRTDRAFDSSQVGVIDEVDPDVLLRQDECVQTMRVAVYVIWQHDMAAGLQELADSRDRGHTRPECDGVLAAVQASQHAFQGRPGRVAAT
jgi:hypothetical protein